MAAEQTKPTERAVQVALWLPVGRANFYSITSDSMLLHVTDGERRECSASYDMPIAFQCSIIRRLLEVLPKSFGYDAVGTYEANDALERDRPTSLTMTLYPAPDPDGPPTQGDANDRLVAEGIDRVQVTVNEDGFYYWTAFGYLEDREEQAIAALREHAAQLLGGDFSLRRSHPIPRKGDEATREYNARHPLGALTFFQLNTLVEGLLNETLYPAVFFEDRKTISKWIETTKADGATSFYSLSTFANVIMLATSDRELPQLAVLRHFLIVTSREVLQRLKWSMESVRRNLLDEMLGILHRHSKLAQLNLASVEPSPYLADAGNEAQMRGYVMLAAAKLPLITNVARHAEAAAANIGGLHLEDGSSGVGRNGTTTEWRGLLAALEENVRSLERAIEHAWMERILYEQEQMRAEQEAIAEIERSHNTVRSAFSADTVINALVLLFTVVTVTWTVQNATKSSAERVGWRAVWVPGTLGTVALLLVVVGIFLHRIWTQVRGTAKAFDLELALRLDQPVDSELVRAYISGERALSSKEGFTITPRAGVRIERVSQDSTLVKLHSVLSQKVRPWRAVHYEIVNEILVHTATAENRVVLRETRLFADTRRRLSSVEVIGLAHAALETTVANMVAKRADFDIDKVIGLAAPLFVSP